MLRVTVDGGGCSGFMYKFSLDSSTKKDDKYVDNIVIVLNLVLF